jgi:hypothetical protein
MRGVSMKRQNPNPQVEGQCQGVHHGASWGCSTANRCWYCQRELVPTQAEVRPGQMELGNPQLVMEVRV